MERDRRARSSSARAMSSSAVVPSGRAEPEEGLGRKLRASRPEEQRTSWQSQGVAAGQPLAGEAQKWHCRQQSRAVSGSRERIGGNDINSSLRELRAAPRQQESQRPMGGASEHGQAPCWGCPKILLRMKASKGT